MARNFPNSPSNGDTVTFNGATYIYNSSNNSWDAETASASGIALTSLSVGTPGTASGSGSLSYNNTTGVFTYTPPDIGSYATESYVDTAITNLVDAAPGALDTLNELAAAIGDDPSFATTVTNSIALKAPLASPALTGTPTAPTATVGTNTTQIATTAFVQGALGSISGNSITDGVSTLDFTGNDLRLDTNFIPSADVTYDLGSATARWKDLYLSGNSINLGGAVISSDGSAIDLPAGSTLGGSAIGGGSGITISDTAPSSPSSGDLWFDSTALSLYMYYDDGSSAQWLQIS